MFSSHSALMYNLGVESFGVLTTLVIYVGCVRNFAKAYDILLLRKMQLAILATLVTDMVAWIADGVDSAAMRFVNNAFCMVHFSLQILVMIIWWKYATFRISGKIMPGIKQAFLLYVPYLIITLILLTTPFTRLYFYVDELNIYHRGLLYKPLFIIHFIYPLIVTVLALIKARRENYRTRRSELITLAIFLVFPLIGSLVQMFMYAVSIVWPCTVLSSLLVFADRSGQDILQDSLTGLNNRRNMERLFRSYEASATVMMLDLDNFKEINDSFGHSMGDTALLATADILRRTFEGSSAFLARYGGDEFVIVMPHGSISLAENTIQKLNAAFSGFRAKKTLPFPLYVSIGYAVSSRKAPSSPLDLLKEADRRMYKIKAAKAKTPLQQDKETNKPETL